MGFEIKGKIFLGVLGGREEEAFYLDLEASVRFGHVERGREFQTGEQGKGPGNVQEALELS